MRIVEYGIVSADDRITLVARVNEFIKLGWEPFGSVGIDYKSMDNTLFQPIVKYQPYVEYSLNMPDYSHMRMPATKQYVDELANQDIEKHVEELKDIIRKAI